MVNDISALSHVPKLIFKNNRMPVQLTFFVTTHCNASCPHCFYAAELNNPKKQDLSLEEVEKISKSMDDLLLLYIGGGEPFLRTDLTHHAPAVGRAVSHGFGDRARTIITIGKA